MPDVLEFVRPRGEFASLFVAALVLWWAASRVARIVNLPDLAVGDLYWRAGVAFVVVGRVAFLAVEAPRSLLDPFVVVRLQGGIEPLMGAGAAALMLLWEARRGSSEERTRLLGAWGIGLLLAVASYDLACPVRDACYGRAVSTPFGFPMSGFADARVATPLIEGALLLALLGAILLLWPRLRAGAVGLWLVAALALARFAFTPLSVSGWDGPTAETVALAATAALAIAGALVVQGLPSTPARTA